MLEHEEGLHLPQWCGQALQWWHLPKGSKEQVAKTTTEQDMGIRLPQGVGHCAVMAPLKE